VRIREHYDDGGVSGGTLERPGLKLLLADIEEGLIDVVVVYKIDRLSRSLMDFSKLVEVFDRMGVTSRAGRRSSKPLTQSAPGAVLYHLAKVLTRDFMDSHKV